MKRITTKLANGYYIFDDEPKNDNFFTNTEMDVSQKLGQYEDIEEKYNIKSVDDLDKKLKALEIIKRKRVDIDKLLYYLKTNACDDSVLSWYNEYSVNFDDERILTTEEFNLLKEVLL